MMIFRVSSARAYDGWPAGLTATSRRRCLTNASTPGWLLCCCLRHDAVYELITLLAPFFGRNDQGHCRPRAATCQSWHPSLFSILKRRWRYSFPHLPQSLAMLSAAISMLLLGSGNSCCQPLPSGWRPCSRSCSRIGWRRCSGFTAALCRAGLTGFQLPLQMRMNGPSACLRVVNSALTGLAGSFVFRRDVLARTPP